MPRPKKCRWISSQPGVTYFKPRGIPMRELEEVCLETDELEAMRLADWDSLSHEQAAEKMNVSRATFGRIVAKGRKKVADALVHGKAIRIEGGEVDLRPPMPHFGDPGGRHRWGMRPR